MHRTTDEAAARSRLDHHRGPLSVALATGLAAALLGAWPAGAAQPAPRAPEVIEGRYIVVYERSTPAPAEKTERLERAKGFTSRLRYGRAVKGFAARLSPKQVSDLRADPDVAFVTPDRPVRALAEVPLASDLAGSTRASQRRFARNPMIYRF